MTNEKFLEKLAHLPQQLSSLPWWQQNLLEESKSAMSVLPRPSESETPTIAPAIPTPISPAISPATSDTPEKHSSSVTDVMQ